MELLGTIRVMAYAIMVPCLVLFACSWKGENKIIPWFFTVQAGVYFVLLVNVAIFGSRAFPINSWELAYSSLVVLQTAICFAMLYQEDRRRRKHTNALTLTFLFERERRHEGRN